MGSKRCPKCGRVYAEEAQICEDCEGALMEVEEPKSGKNGDLVLLTTVAEMEEALVLVNVLEAEGIPAVIDDQSPLFWTQGVGSEGNVGGGVRVMVNSNDSEAALELLEEHRRGELALKEDEDPEAAE